MKEFRIIELKEGVFKRNADKANALREKLSRDGTLLLNLMGSPGVGKTTLLIKSIQMLKDEMSIAVMEADIDSDVDSKAVARTGTSVIQMHTGGMCHLDAEMTRQGIDALGADSADLIILENVGNLVCPAEFDTGAGKNAMILSVPEGDDKPLKYPLMFKVSDALLISKYDTLEMFDFDLDICIERVKKLNPDIEIFPVSAKTGEGMEAWINWLRHEVADVRNRGQ